MTEIYPAEHDEPFLTRGQVTYDIRNEGYSDWLITDFDSERSDYQERRGELDKHLKELFKTFGLDGSAWHEHVALIRTGAMPEGITVDSLSNHKHESCSDYLYSLAYNDLPVESGDYDVEAHALVILDLPDGLQLQLMGSGMCYESDDDVDWTLRFEARFLPKESLAAIH